MDWCSGVGDKKVKERKRLILPGLRSKPIKSLTQDLVSHEGTGHPLDGGWRHSAPSLESLRSLGRRVSKTGLCTPRNQPKRERETKTQGPKLWWSKGAIMIFLWVYIGRSTRSFFRQWWRSENQMYSNRYQGNKGWWWSQGQETIHISRKGIETKQFCCKENVY